MISARTDLTLALLVRERYQLMQFLPANASRELVFGLFKDIQDVLALNDEEVAEWGFERTDNGVTHPDPEYEEEGNRVEITMKRALWTRLRAGANIMLNFPNTDLGRDTFTRLDTMLNDAAVLKKSAARNAPKAARRKRTNHKKEKTDQEVE